LGVVRGWIFSQPPHYQSPMDKHIQASGVVGVDFEKINYESYDSPLIYHDQNRLKK
jgi:hypothetical protein